MWLGLGWRGTALCVLVTLAVAGGRQDGDIAPKKREISRLMGAYVLIEGRGEAEMARQDEILERIALLPAPDARTIKKFKKDMLKLWSKGPKLKKKSGRHYLWEDEEKGLYIVGGGKKAKGLFIGMHGGGVGSGDAGAAHGGWNSAVSGQGWIGIFPQVLKKTEHGWTTDGTEEFVLELVDRACRTWKIPRDKVYFGGHSMGGFGTWTLGAHHADRVAGLTASAGAPTCVKDRATEEIIDIEAGVIPNLRNVPIVIYQSDDDRNVPPDVNRAAAKFLGKAQEKWGGYDFEYWEVEGRGHAFPPGGVEVLLEKVEKKERNTRPAKIVWQPALEWKRQFYWLYWKDPKLGVIVEAELDREANAVRLTSSDALRGFSVFLDEEMLDLSREIVVTKDGEERYRGIPEKSLATILCTGAKGDEPMTFEVAIDVSPND